MPGAVDWDPADPAYNLASQERMPFEACLDPIKGLDLGGWEYYDSVWTEEDGFWVYDIYGNQYAFLDFMEELMAGRDDCPWTEWDTLSMGRCFVNYCLVMLCSLSASPPG